MLLIFAQQLWVSAPFWWSVVSHLSNDFFYILYIETPLSVILIIPIFCLIFCFRFLNSHFELRLNYVSDCCFFFRIIWSLRHRCLSTFLFCGTSRKVSSLLSIRTVRPGRPEGGGGREAAPGSSSSSCSSPWSSQTGGGGGGPRHRHRGGAAVGEPAPPSTRRRPKPPALPGLRRRGAEGPGGPQLRPDPLQAAARHWENWEHWTQTWRTKGECLLHWLKDNST